MSRLSPIVVVFWVAGWFAAAASASPVEEPSRLPSSTPQVFRSVIHMTPGVASDSLVPEPSFSGSHHDDFTAPSEQIDKTNPALESIPSELNGPGASVEPADIAAAVRSSTLSASKEIARTESTGNAAPLVREFSLGAHDTPEPQMLWLLTIPGIFMLLRSRRGTSRD